MTMTGRHPQLHNPHPAQPGSPSRGRNPVCRRNLLVALEIALLGKGPNIHLTVEALATASPHTACLLSPGSEKQQWAQSYDSHTQVSGVWKAVQSLPLSTTGMIHRPRHSLDT